MYVKASLLDGYVRKKVYVMYVCMYVCMYIYAYIMQCVYSYKI
jgi:hypothetical protein